MDAQLSFIDLIVPKESAPLTVMDRLAAGLKAQRFAELDRVDWLQEQVRRLHQRTERTENEHHVTGQCAG